MESTASPTADLAVAGDVPVAKKEATGAPRNREGVREDLIDGGEDGHPGGERTPKLEPNGQVRDLLPIPGVVREAKGINKRRGIALQNSKGVKYLLNSHLGAYRVNPTV